MFLVVPKIMCREKFHVRKLKELVHPSKRKVSQAVLYGLENLQVASEILQGKLWIYECPEGLDVLLAGLLAESFLHVHIDTLFKEGALSIPLVLDESCEVVEVIKIDLLHSP